MWSLCVASINANILHLFCNCTAYSLSLIIRGYCYYKESICCEKIICFSKITEKNVLFVRAIMYKYILYLQHTEKCDDALGQLHNSRYFPLPVLPSHNGLKLRPIILQSEANLKWFTQVNVLLYLAQRLHVFVRLNYANRISLFLVLQLLQPFVSSLGILRYSYSVENYLMRHVIKFITLTQPLQDDWHTLSSDQS